MKPGLKKILIQSLEQIPSTADHVGVKSSQRNIDAGGGPETRVSLGVTLRASLN